VSRGCLGSFVLDRGKWGKYSGLRRGCVLRNPVKVRSCAATVIVRKLAASKYPEQEKNMSERRRAFDLTSYIRADGSFDMVAALGDAAAVAVETNVGKPEYQRIWPYTLVALPDDRVVQLKPNGKLGDTDVRNFLNYKTSLDRIESAVANERIERMLDEPCGTIMVWVSPPGGPLDYDGGRIDLGFVKTIKGIRMMASYGIVATFEKERYRYIGWGLEEFSGQKLGDGDPREELRRKLFVIQPPAGMKPVDLLREVIPAEQIWDGVESDKAIKQQEEAIRMAYQVWEMNRELIGQRIAEGNYVAAENILVAGMRERGYAMASGPCGVFSIDMGNGSFIEIKLLPYKFDKVGFCKRCHEHRKLVCGYCKDCGRALAKKARYN
jgi:hypothetical protein